MIRLNKINSLGLLALICTLFYGCTEFIEPSLTSRTVVIISPANQSESNIYQQTFWWEPQADALGYRLQVVAPKFSNASKFVLDTLIKTDKFTFTLEPGNYEWRVRAENGSSVSSYTTNSLVIHPSSLKEQSVQLSTPTDVYYTSDANISFSWLKLFGASQYRLQIDNQNFADETKLTLNAVSDNTVFLHKLLKEGAYQYRVRAESTSEVSKWSVVRNLVYDVTAPSKPDLVSPANKQTITLPTKLLWNKVTDAEKYELYLYQKDSVTLYNTNYPALLTTNEQTISSGTQGETFVWRTRAIDKAGNKSSFSDYRTFTIQ
ncbi:hypothetical protein DHW03_03225 [Pedobacter yonginense]|uniref:Fibronectin type-III domain-containing protein n=1 Tax=Pedobacter yonginense TaxID=651869 RepID=A0A317ESR6_9SPHI|nr:hypothetical protein [Pedobacter yonginense]PWS28859.1 hypothetical protein DHW03_03225 [Pedobacter yonginense]